MTDSIGQKMALKFGPNTVLGVLVVALLAATPARAACPQINGALQQGGLIWMKVNPDSTVTLDGVALDVLADGTTVAGFGRDAAATARLQVRATNGVSCALTLQVSPRSYVIQRVDGVPSRTVNPPAAQLQRIRRETALVRAARAQRLPRADLLSDLLHHIQWPVLGPVSGVYGSQRVYNGEPRRPHYGVDVAAPPGTPVHAPAAGVVTLAQPDLFYSGGTVILDHGFSLSSTFLHMRKVAVKVGDELRRGDVIGEVGATGRATGPHLDWRMNWRGVRIDPQLLVPPMPMP